MSYLEAYLKKLSDRGNVKLADSIRKTAKEIGESYLKSFSFTSHEIGLLFGNVQSGKTGQVFGIISEAADLGFPAFLLLTTDNVVLQQQTLERVKTDLKGYCICGENDTTLFATNSLADPVIVVLKKNSRILKLWANVFNSTGFMKGNPLFIIDDEADAASLNTLVNKDKQSAINKYLDAIKNGASSSLYLQVTGTPQALLLQTIVSGWHPMFSYYFRPGEGYLGGDFFFPNQKPDCIQFNENLNNPSLSVVIRHIAVSAQILSAGGKVSNCLVHPSVRQAVHKECAAEIEQNIEWCLDHLAGEFKNAIKAECDQLFPERAEKVGWNDFWTKAQYLVTSDAVKVLIMNGKTEIESDEYASGCNFIVGGNTLGRGVTFPALQTIYYTRSSKNPQADTMWQHSRMFGYDRDPGLMKVFIDSALYKLFSDINATNNSLIAQVEKGIDDITVYYPQGLNPTRKAVLDNDHVEMISGGTNYYPAYPKNDSIEAISELLKVFDSGESYYQVSLRLMTEILGHISTGTDFNMKAFISVINTMLAKQPTCQGVLVVRRNRDVAQGTGALLSPNDWKLSGSFPSKVVLTMYQVTGNKGWGGEKLWVPNIKLPDGVVYYDVAEQAGK